MNNINLQKHLTAFKKWGKANKVQFEAEKKEREELSLQVQSYTDERLKQITEDELFDYIAPLWAMAMWGNKHYQINNIIEANGMPLLRVQLSNLYTEKLRLLSVGMNLGLRSRELVLL